MLRKSCWDPSIDDSLMAETSTLNLLYIQTVSDIERGWILTSADTKQQLALMQVNPNESESTPHCYFYNYILALSVQLNVNDCY